MRHIRYKNYKIWSLFKLMFIYRVINNLSNIIKIVAALLKFTFNVSKLDACKPEQYIGLLLKVKAIVLNKI